MGVDCRIALNPNARVRDVADVLAMLAGNTGYWQGSNSARWWEIDGVKVLPYSHDAGVPECCRIVIEKPSPLYPYPMERMYHFEFEVRDPVSRNVRQHWKGLLSRSTAFWCAAGKRLVEFFGGAVGYQDWSGKDDLVVPMRHDVGACDGEEWDRFQERKAAVQPLTPEEIEAGRAVCAYPDCT